ncbi:MAG: alpha/beta hydrolase family protein [Thermoguttaceae bacterium]
MTNQLVIFLFLFASCAIASTYTEDWYDSKRDRTVPVRIYLPEKSDGIVVRHPVVLLSHGLGGSRDGFPYLGDFWSNHGYVVIVMQHHGSDGAVWKNRGERSVLEAMRSAVTAKEATNRVGDAKFVLDELKCRNENNDKSERLFGIIDMSRIGIGGHSFGSHTTTAMIGRLPYTPDSRIKAAIAMSAAGPENGDAKQVFEKVKTPIMFLTGTKDYSPILPEIEPVHRRIPFDSIDETEQFLAIFDDGDHMLFSGHARFRGLSALEKKYQPIIQELTLLFLDSYLMESPEARQKLMEMKTLPNDSGTFEKKGIKTSTPANALLTE